ncbi:hypothetical protein [Scytonema sp. PCC 10023]|uniref:hypothetical protein n=1 Tax=Scytonema sp. PCC 10023 TaxID=1680591 RepID=UPI0039C70F94
MFGATKPSQRKEIFPSHQSPVPHPGATIIYGCVSNGTQWRFLKLEGTVVSQLRW